MIIPSFFKRSPDPPRDIQEKKGRKSVNPIRYTGHEADFYAMEAVEGHPSFNPNLIEFYTRTVGAQ